MCRATTSRFAFESIQQIVGQRVKEPFRDLEFVPGKTDRPSCLPQRRQRTNLGDGCIPFAKDDRFPLRKPVKILRQVRLRLMDIQPYY